MTRTSKLILLTIGCLLLLLLAAGCEIAPEFEKTSSRDINVELSISGSPVLEKPVQITATFGLRKGMRTDAQNTTASIILPEGFELIDGRLDWNGDVLRDKTYKISARIKAVKMGDWKIEAKVTYSLDKVDWLVETDSLYIYIFEKRAIVK